MTFCNVCFREGKFEIEALCDDCWSSLNNWIKEKETLEEVLREEHFVLGDLQN